MKPPAIFETLPRFESDMSLSKIILRYMQGVRRENFGRKQNNIKLYNSLYFLIIKTARHTKITQNWLFLSCNISRQADCMFGNFFFLSNKTNFIHIPKYKLTFRYTFLAFAIFNSATNSHS